MSHAAIRNILVKGAGSGIGRAVARQFHQAGHRLALLDYDRPSLEKLQSELEGASPIRLYETDISDAAQVETACQDLLHHWATIDVVVANAGVNGQWAPLDELEVDQWRRTLAINLNGTFYTIKFALPGLKKRGGAVVVTSSINGVRVFSSGGATAYSASKAGQVGMAKMLALELAPHKIRVNVVCPGAIDTEIDQSTERTDLDRARQPVEYPAGVVPLNEGNPGSAEQVAEVICYLCSDQASLVTGSVVFVDGAESLLQG
ncbi:SDR family oxidoreductase [Lignipirellula cremea]|uniref:Levodione reductase n=1 Tax=Lignipirellula cremea TaxID=2528010 RepID=A0A518DSM2_9BACT|nr:SDR family NAD(P)-dependent oxidoreductase [Lignipirellula cremea]QDU94840.1 Levodione reductase [Lignipirellula cremea]